MTAGGQALVEQLRREGVQIIFGIPGVQLDWAVDALCDAVSDIQFIVPRHEQAVSYMADGYARESGKIGVCCATSGPGTTNLITGIACAHDSSVPLLVISGLPALPSFGKGALQEPSSNGVNAFAMFDHCTNYNAMVSHVSQFERKLVNALMTAHQPPERCEQFRIRRGLGHARASA